MTTRIAAKLRKAIAKKSVRVKGIPGGETTILFQACAVPGRGQVTHPPITIGYRDPVEDLMSQGITAQQIENSNLSDLIRNRLIILE